jgi:ribonuclease BN (tRNA processing enzyme)
LVNQRALCRPRPDTTTPSSRHAEQVGKIAAAAEVKKLVLTHIIPPKDGEKMREIAARNFKGEIIVGTDLLRVVP